MLTTGGVLPQKILKFRVLEMPSPGFSAGHFQEIMGQKFSGKLFILTISRVFSVSYSVPKRKKYKNNEDRSQQRARRPPLDGQTPLPTCQYPSSYVYVYEGLLGNLIFRPSSYFAEEILVSSCY